MLEGYKTFLGLLVSFAGLIGIADFFGGTEGTENFLNLLLQVVGLAYAAYGRYAATKTY